MTKKERIQAIFENRIPDKCPATFSLHFPEDCAAGDKALKAHLDFFNSTDTDILKIMNENVFSRIDEIKTPSDWNFIPQYSLKDSFMQKQIDLIKRILDSCDSSAFTMATVHGVFVSALHPIRWIMPGKPSRLLLCKHLRENRQPVVDALNRVTEGLCIFVQAIIETGIDSIFYASLGGEKHFLTDEEYAEVIAPLDKEVLSIVKKSSARSFLHICKENLNMNRFSTYSSYCDAINWGIYEAPYSVSDAQKLFPGKVICGGLSNRDGILFDGSENELKKTVLSLAQQIGKNRFILGADCTLPTDTPVERIRFVTDIVHSCYQ